MVSGRTYTPHSDELSARIEQIASVGFRTIGWQPRKVDFGLCKLMADTCRNDPQIIEVVAEYCWDHLLGEPNDPNLEGVTKAIIANLTAADAGTPIVQ